MKVYKAGSYVPHRKRWSRGSAMEGMIDEQDETGPFRHHGSPQLSTFISDSRVKTETHSRRV